MPPRIYLGTRLTGLTEQLPVIRTTSHKLVRHKSTPYFRAWLGQQYPELLPPEALVAQQQGDEKIGITSGREGVADRHLLILGGSGMGKSRLYLSLLRQQLEQGDSVVMLDPKPDTIHQVMALALELGIPPEKIAYLAPQFESIGVPGWNLFLAEPGRNPIQAAKQFSSLFEGLVGELGARMRPFLENLLLLLFLHGNMSLLELMHCLGDSRYRDVLVHAPVEAADPFIISQIREFFARFGQLSQSDQTLTLAALQNKLQTLSYSSYFRALLCAQSNSLSLPLLWQEQRIVVVHMDEVLLGVKEAHFLGGLLVNSLYQAMLQKPDGGARAVVLAIDELGQLIPFLSTSVLESIVTLARSKRLRLQVATQNFSQLSSELQTRLMSSASTRVFFRLGPQDARLVTSTFSAGSAPSAASITVNCATGRGRGEAELEPVSWTQEVLDDEGEPLRISSEDWEDFQRRVALADLYETSTSGQDDNVLLLALERIVGAHGILRLYTRDPLTGQNVALRTYLKGLAPWKDFHFSGSDVVRLVIQFPQPGTPRVQQRSISDLNEFWMGRLQRMGKQSIAAYLDGDVHLLRTLDTDLPDTDSEPFQAYLRAVLQSGGQPPERIAQDHREREERRKQLMEEQVPVPENAPTTDERPAARQRRKSSPPEVVPPGDTPVLKPIPTPQEDDDGSI
nr:type IV secretory system conjugative DNA transfer family protein [Armatimonas rosea]